MKQRRPGRLIGLAVALALLAVVLLGACGRTALYGAEPCSEEGATRQCLGVCGIGVSTCHEGFFSACEVELTVEPCQNDCGRGTRSCESEVWSECEVEPTSRSCENDCGVGVEECADGVWGSCRVAPVERECGNKCGTGTETCTDGAWANCSAPQPLPPVLRALVRDFSDTHPDMETELSGVDHGIVEDRLGPDGRPVYAGGPGGTPTTTGPAAFDQWFRDVPGVNMATEIELPLAVSPADPRLYVYYNAEFFPIDNQLFGNQGRIHNYHFTLEASGTFVYQGGEIFRFTGDDDVFVFVNERLVIDIGGLHESLSEEVELDDVAGHIGLQLGSEYPIAIFFAERKTVASNFNIETSIAGLGECP